MLSKKNKEALFNPFSKDNPVLVQILGICSTLAVTVNLEPAIVMGISVTAVLAFSNVIISLTSAGSTFLIACGKMIFCIVFA